MEKINKRKNYKHPNLNLKNSEIIIIRNAFINSMYANCPLNRHVTLNVEKLTGDQNYQHIFKLLRDMYTKFAKSKGFQPTYLMVVEIGECTGLHLHILFHIPSCSKNRFIDGFKKRVRKQLLRYIDKPEFDKSIVNYKTVGFGRNLNKPDYYSKVVDLADGIITSQNKIGSEELREYQSVQRDDPNWFLKEDIDLIRIFNYFCKGIEPFSEGSFYARIFSCSEWVKPDPKILDRILDYIKCNN